MPHFNPQDNGLYSQDFLEETPDFAFQAFRPTRGVNFPGASLSFFDFYKNRQSQVENEFIGQQGRLAASGQPPTGSLTDFFHDYPWLERYLALPAGQRGVRFGPPARWLIPR